MTGSTVLCVIAVATISAFLLAWTHYQKARDKERMFLLERGVTLEEIIKIQNVNKFKFIFPWQKVGIVTAAMSLAFLAIAALVYYLESDRELLKGFLITAILGIFLSAGMITNHLVGKNGKDTHG